MQVQKIKKLSSPCFQPPWYSPRFLQLYDLRSRPPFSNCSREKTRLHTDSWLRLVNRSRDKASPRACEKMALGGVGFPKSEDFPSNGWRLEGVWTCISKAFRKYACVWSIALQKAQSTCCYTNMSSGNQKLPQKENGIFKKVMVSMCVHLVGT